MNGSPRVTLAPGTVETAEQALRMQTVPDDFLRFAHALQAADAFAGEIENVLYFIEKPWKWSREYAAWIVLGKPTDESDDGWDRFQQEIPDA